MRHTQPLLGLDPPKRGTRPLLRFHRIVRVPGIFPVIAFLTGIRSVPNLGSASFRGQTDPQSLFLIFSASRGSTTSARLEEP